MKEYQAVIWGAREDEHQWTDRLNEAAQEGWVVHSVAVRGTGEVSPPDWVVALMERDAEIEH